jgi:hypothetical protein
MEAYPLTWPEGWPRVEPYERTRARFNKKVSRRSSTTGYSWKETSDLSIADSIDRVIAELRKFGVEYMEDIIISTNLKTGISGRALSKQRAPEDPGAAVYWQRTGDTEMRVMAIDIYDRVEGNLAAIAATLEAMRSIERHGGAEILARTFTGFIALEHGESWQSVLHVATDCTLKQCERNFKMLRSRAHPDKEGGSHEAFIELEEAMKKARKHFNG